jgi:hypothetical protein
LTDALADASNAGRSTEVRIAQGTYRPGYGGTDRNSTFAVLSGVSLSGGFGGLRSSTPDLQSDRFVTVLSGDLLGDDGESFANRGDNCFHVVTRFGGNDAFNVLSGNSGAYTLSHLTICGGQADGSGDQSRGAGVNLILTNGSDGEFVLGQCILKDNFAASGGAGVYAPASARLTLFQCTVADNDGAGAVWCLGRTGVFNCIVNKNRGVGLYVSILDAWNSRITDNSNMIAPSTFGGGLRILQSARIHACTIAGNSARFGAGLYATGTYLHIVSSFIGHNAATEAGGGIWSVASLTQVDLSTIVGNSASVTGGGVQANTRVQMAGSILARNTAFERGQMFASELVIRDVLVPSAAGIVTGHPIVAITPLRTTNPRFIDQVGTSSDPLSWQDKNYRLAPGSPAIDGTDVQIGSELIGSSIGYDADGITRPLNTTCSAYARNDLGAFESTSDQCGSPIPRLYVNAAAIAGGNGRSWETAFRDINEALATPGVREVWIAQGTYRPDRGLGDPTLSYRIESPFVALRGGFAGTETDASQSAPAVHPTVITGDLAGNDSVANPATRSENSRMLLAIDIPVFLPSPPRPDRNIITGVHFRNTETPADAPIDTSALLVRNASVDVSDCVFAENASSVPSPWTLYPDPLVSAGGPALRVSGMSSVTLSSSKFVRNSATTDGGAVNVTSSEAPYIQDCEFVENSAGNAGGALYIEPDGVLIERSTFVRNSVQSSSDAPRGGAIAISRGSAYNCRFFGNHVSGPGCYGGAVYGSQTSLFACAFSGNRAMAITSGGIGLGGAVASSTVRLFSCTMYDNTGQAGSGGPGTAVNYSGAGWSGQSEIANSIIYNPGAVAANQPVIARYDYSGSATLPMYSCIVSGPMLPSALNTRSVDPRLLNALGADGAIGTADDDLRPGATSPAIDAGSTQAYAGRPTDLLGLPREVDIPSISNVQSGLDIGAYEFQLTTTCRIDFNANGRADIDDIFTYLAAWFRQEPSTNFDTSPAIALDDLFIFLSAWFAGC